MFIPEKILNNFRETLVAAIEEIDPASDTPKKLGAILHNLAVYKHIQLDLEHYRRAAMLKSRDPELEIDDHAIVSEGEDAGAYVMAWLWVSDSEVEKNRDR